MVVVLISVLNMMLFGKCSFSMMCVRLMRLVKFYSSGVNVG